MRRQLFVALLGISFLGIPVLVGCEDKNKTSKTDVHNNPDGSTTVDKKTTETDKNGNTSTSTEHKTVP